MKITAVLGILLLSSALLASVPAEAAHRRRHRASHASSRRKTTTYVVQDENSLAEVAVRLYGDADLWLKIARWNHMRRPYAIWKGRKLKLRRKPALNAAQGNEALLAFWRKHFGLEGPPPERAPARPATASAAPPPAPADLALVRRIENGEDADAEDLGDNQLQARALLTNGEKSFRDRKYPEALAKFHDSRELDPDSIPAWLYEIRTLKLLTRDKEAQEVSRTLLERKPELRTLPMFKAASPQPPAEQAQ